jgi:hypothetical protein
LHIVHTYADGSLGGVIGIMFNETSYDGPHLLDEVAAVIESGND